jgi:hypothetical protein
MEPLFLTTDEVLSLHAEQIRLFGGLSGIRDMGLLQSAVGSVEATFGGAFLHETLYSRRAAPHPHGSDGARGRGQFRAGRPRLQERVSAARRVHHLHPHVVRSTLSVDSSSAACDSNSAACDSNGTAFSSNVRYTR